MGMYCCCGVKKLQNGWKCECDWTGWFRCFPCEKIDIEAPIQRIPLENGIYYVRVFEDGNDYEDISEFCINEKNWGEYTNEAISNWKIEYSDNWMGYRGVYAWKPIEKDGK